MRAMRVIKGSPLRQLLRQVHIPFVFETLIRPLFENDRYAIDRGDVVSQHAESGTLVCILAQGIGQVVKLIFIHEWCTWAMGYAC